MLKNIPILLVAIAATLGAAPAKKQSPATPATPATNSNTAQIIFQGTFPQTVPEVKEERLLYSTQSTTTGRVMTKHYDQTDKVSLKVIQGEMNELICDLGGVGEISHCKGTGVLHWGVRTDAKGKRTLAIELKKGTKATVITVGSRYEYLGIPTAFSPLVITPTEAAFADGTLKIERFRVVAAGVKSSKGLSPIKSGSVADPKPLEYRWSGTAYSLSLDLSEADPEARIVRFNDFELAGDLGGGVASFVLSGVAEIRHPEGGGFELLSGDIALTEYSLGSNAQLTLVDGRYLVTFSTNGEFPIEVRFNAKISRSEAWSQVSFWPPPGTLRPVSIQGLGQDTQVRFLGAADAEPIKGGFASHLPANGELHFQWQGAKKEVVSKLFYAVTGGSHIVIGPGLMRQFSRLEYEIMQGSLRELIVRMSGDGKITRVDGNNILTWKEETDDDGRLLRVRLNQDQKSNYSLSVATQSPLGSFPLKVKPVRLVPSDAIRYGGYLRVINSGAVRLEATTSTGLAQISLDRLPKELFAAVATKIQAFAFRSSGPVFDLELQADNILPELTVSQVLQYHLGETERRISAELELDIREAPLREFTINVPTGYELLELSANSLADRTLENGELTLQFSQPLSGRQLINFQLSQNHDSPPASWTLPAVQPQKVKSLRGFLGVSADAGLRVAEASANDITEIATAFFPKQIKELQLAYRLREEAWQVAVTSERLALAIQADTLHLFNLAEGIAYGSSLMNYVISGAPVSVLKVEVPTNYTNVEFVGQEIRNWNQIAGGYEVHLHTPISGPYSLVASYDAQFRSGDQLSFTGLRPLEVQSEQGHVILVSDYQFTTEAVNVSEGLISLEPGEVPVEYRLLFDAPLLRAYQFTARPVEIDLKLDSLAQGKTVDQVIERAMFETHVSGEGQVLTIAKYLVKSKGNSRLRLTVPATDELWTASVNGREVVPVIDGADTLIPLPQNLPANTIIPVDLKLASKAGGEKKVPIALPKVNAPILLASWNVSPDTGYRLLYDGGSVSPNASVTDVSGFVWFGKFLDGLFSRERQGYWWFAWASLAVGSLVWLCGTSSKRFRFDGVNVVALAVGVVGIGFAAFVFVDLAQYSSRWNLQPDTALKFIIPVQAAGNTLNIALANQSLADSQASWTQAWLLIPAFAIWIFALTFERGTGRQAAVALGWIVVFWTALRTPNGAQWFFGALAVFALVHALLPLGLRQWNLPPRPPKTPQPDTPDSPAEETPDSPAAPEGSAGAGATALLVGGLLLGGMFSNPAAAREVPPHPIVKVVDSVIQTATVAGGKVSVNAEMIWTAAKGDQLNFLNHQAVLKQVKYPTAALKLGEGATIKMHNPPLLDAMGNPIQSSRSGSDSYRLTATRAGTYTIAFDYEVAVQSQQGAQGFYLATHFGLVNRLRLKLDSKFGLVTPNAVSVKKVGENEIDMFLSPAPDSWIAWQPLTRDVTVEETVFYTELQELFIPAAGIVEGVHETQIRIVQGQVRELAFDTPEGMTITEVAADGMSDWRFDPDEKKLRLSFATAHTQPFMVRVSSQFTTGPLPFKRALGILKVEGADGQIGMVGVAAGSEVQIADVENTGLTPINLEDFPPNTIVPERNRISGLTLRRAFRYSDPTVTLNVDAAPVQSDIRVVANNSLSLGEDRTVLSSQLDVLISRAGVFNLSFVLPAGMAPESFSGKALSHWTESESGTNRVITLHLNAKTLGRTQFTIQLVGPGIGAQSPWNAPELNVREAEKQTGQLVVVPEQGIRLHVSSRDGLNQLDPKSAGITRRGVLVFRLLRADWDLAFNIEKVDPWVQVASLQDITIREGQLKVAGTLKFTIENAGLKSLFVQVPAGAEAVRFTGDQLADALPVAAGLGQTNEWEIKLHRRMIGDYRLQVAYQLPAAAQVDVTGFRPTRVNLHRGYLSLRTTGRLQITLPRLPATLQASEWQAVPADLRPGIEQQPDHVFRALEADYTLPISIIRHDAASLLPARVIKTELASGVSASGMLLTSVKLTMHPGSKRSLQVTLPPGARFWYAFVNQSSVWPWREGDQILLPLEKSSKAGQPITVDFFYSANIAINEKNPQLALVGPQFDLPLENVQWAVYLPPNWRLKDWDTKLQILNEDGQAVPVVFDVSDYLAQENQQHQQQTKEAESLLAMGNKYLASGRQAEARRAYQSAFTLSQHDSAFNEDTRVQLHKLKMQQAVVGLNYRRHLVVDEEQKAGKDNDAIKILSENQEANYTQQEAKKALDGNSGEVNTTLMRLAESLVRQQNAAKVTPAAIRASLPTHGHAYGFTRSLQVNKNADLSINLEADIPSSGSNGSFKLLSLLFIGAFVVLMINRKRVEAV